jgi:hypothetical protein
MRIRRCLASAGYPTAGYPTGVIQGRWLASATQPITRVRKSPLSEVQQQGPSW